MHAVLHDDAPAALRELLDEMPSLAPEPEEAERPAPSTGSRPPEEAP